MKKLYSKILLGLVLSVLTCSPSYSFETDIPLVAESERASVRELGTTPLIENGLADSVRFSFAPSPENSNKSLLLVFHPGSPRIAFLDLEKAGAVWSNIDMMPTIPLHPQGFAVQQARVDGVSGFLDEGRPTLLVATTAYYLNPTASRFSNVLRGSAIQRGSSTGWATVHQEFETSPANNGNPPINLFYRFSHNPEFGLIYAFLQPQIMGTAEDEAGSAYSSADSGFTWKEMEFASPAEAGLKRPELGLPFAMIVRIPGTNQIWAATDNPCKDKGGVSMSPDGGKTWLNMYDVLPTRMVSFMTYDVRERRLLIGAKNQGSTFSSGSKPAIFEVDLSQVTSALKIRKVELPYVIDSITCRTESEYCDAAISDGGTTDFYRLHRRTWTLIARHGLQIGKYTTAVPGVLGKYVSRLVSRSSTGGISTANFVYVRLP